VKPIADRFFAFVQKTDGCWLWTGGCNEKGYGYFGGSGITTVRAHIWSWRHVNGPVPKGLQLDHRCHNADPSCPGGVDCLHRKCVNPKHLEPVTPRINARRGRGIPPITLERRTARRTTRTTATTSMSIPSGEETAASARVNAASDGEGSAL
jgi:HNH endonuclease